MANKITKQNLKNVNDSAELLNYIINVTPQLRGEIDLPQQGESINGIGKLILKNVVYKNAFLNTINLIARTVITRNRWENPWTRFTDKGTISYGMQVREIIVDIANVYDYNEMLKNEEHFIKTEVPNVLSSLHEINYQKYYKTTTSDEQMAMAFERGDLFTLIDEIVNSLYEGMEYDNYLVNKYMLARRIIDGTVTAVEIENFATKSDRDIVSDIKEVSNNMTFRSPNFNPAGIRKATKFENQFAIVSTKFDAKFTTNVLATSYFRSDAELKAHMELVDGFGNFDMDRLDLVFAKRDENGNVVKDDDGNVVHVDGYIPLTEEERTQLNAIPCVIVGEDFFQDYRYGLDDASESSSLRTTEFFNPQTLKKNIFLHVWGSVSSSPFENACVFTTVKPAVSGVTVSPVESTVSASIGTVQLTASVETEGFANKAVKWSVVKGMNQGVTVSQTGLVTIPKNFAPAEAGITVRATSIYDESQYADAVITVA